MSQANETGPGPGLSEQLALLHLEQEIDSICDSFESAWRSGRHPELAEYLNQTKLPASTLFVELVQIDLDYRRRSGEKITIEEYVERYPQFSDALSQLMPALETVSMPMPVERRPVVLGRFELVSMLGEGTFGVVWKARDTKLRQWVAIKRFRETMLARNRELFAREARAVARLNHPNVVRLLELSQGALTDYIVFEFVEGKNLKKVLSDRRGKPLEPENAARIALQLAEGLAHVHEAGFIHRDFKPANVILAPDGTAKILDFGLAKHAEATSTITAADGLLGTIPYMSPEQCEESPVGPATDIYSLGAVLYEMLSGRRPFEGTPKEMVAKIPKGGAPDFEAPAPLKAIVRRAMEIDPLDRYPRAADFVRDLQSFLAGESLVRRPRRLTRAVGKLARRRQFLLAAAGLTATAACGLYLNRTPPVDDGKKTVHLTTEPPGARVSFIPLSAEDGHPLPEQLVPATTLSPVEVRLAPGDYLVVAALEDGSERFHEVYRHVPPDPKAITKNWHQVNWEVDPQDRLVWPSIKIPASSVTSGMVLVDGGRDLRLGPAPQPGADSMRFDVPPFFVDPHELTVGDFLALQAPKISSKLLDALWKTQAKGKPPNAAMTNISFEEAVSRAEDSGKRLVQEWEFLFLTTNGGTTRFPWGNELPAPEAWPEEVGDVGGVGFDRIASHGGEITGVCSNVAEWVDSYRLLRPMHWSADGLPQTGLGGRRAIRGGNPAALLPGQGMVAEFKPDYANVLRPHGANDAIGVRFARSTRPRLVPADFPRPRK